MKTFYWPVNKERSQSVLRFMPHDGAGLISRHLNQNNQGVTLPDGRRFAIAVYTKNSTTSEADHDRAIAEVTRTLYDFYYLTAQDK